MHAAMFMTSALALLALVQPIVGVHIIGTINDKGEYVTEDIDIPVPAPAAVDIKNLDFMLYTRKNQDTPYSLLNNDIENLNNSPFNATLATIFIIHGWQSSYKAAPVQNLKDTYLINGCYNIILLNWEKYNSPYLSSWANAKGIGKQYAGFVNFLISKGLNPKRIHIIGHSLGAHIAGFTGKNTNQKVGRITGCDPAGPLFTDSKAEGRLDKDDAVFVDAIHTSTLAGISKAIAQVDFFANGGSNQPSCNDGGCDHTIVYQYFANSVNSPTLYPARVCASQSEAKTAGKSNVCTPSSAFMGVDAINTAIAGVYYVPME